MATGDEIGRSYTLRYGQTFVIGRSRKVAIQLRDDQLVSRHHAALELKTEGLLVTDLDSRNGTQVDAVPLSANLPTLLKPGEVLTVGRHTFSLTLHSPEEEEDQEEDQEEEEEEDQDAVRTQSFRIVPPLPPSEYRILGLIGEGTNGRVFAAEQVLMRRRVAIKVLDARYKDGSEERKRFLREGQIGSLIHSPHIVDVYDVRIAAGQVCLVMELVQGPSAHDRLHNGPIPLREALRIGEDIANALQAAEDFGVVHRDIKPSNILLDPRGLAKLMDFGMAKSMDARVDTTPFRHAARIARSYTSPEQVLSWDGADVRSDIYSLGATLYHLIRGEPLGATPGLTGSTRSAPAVDDRVEPLITAMLHQDPEQRPYPPKHLRKRFHDLRVRLFPDSARMKLYETGEHRAIMPEND